MVVGRWWDERAPVSSGDVLLSDFEAVLEQEEAALVNLERLLEEKRRVLADPHPDDLLEALTHIEEAVGRLGQLETMRASQERRLACGAEGLPGTGVDTAVRAAQPSAPDGVLAIRHRILGLIARIAQRNEANAHLLGGLSRVTENAVRRLSQIERGGELSSPGVANDRLWRRSAALDYQA